MSGVEEDDSREERIDMEIVVDAYTEEERAMGWYYYLDEKLQFPFKAQWKSGKKSKVKQVDVVEMSSSDDCQHDMFVEVRYREGTVEDFFSARLSDIQPLDVDPETSEAIADWHYWVARGYQF